mmetsp:Transcript_37358/g.75719  ORF Transcript_37358/g.75719 Transcript_37358/m.75719 type:complete len:606 (-) Transcript_37358:1293-3110(-)
MCLDLSSYASSAAKAAERPVLPPPTSEPASSSPSPLRPPPPEEEEDPDANPRKVASLRSLLSCASASCASSASAFAPAAATASSAPAAFSRANPRASLDASALLRSWRTSAWPASRACSCRTSTSPASCLACSKACRSLSRSSTSPSTSDAFDAERPLSMRCIDSTSPLVCFISLRSRTLSSLNLCSEASAIALACSRADPFASARRHRSVSSTTEASRSAKLRSCASTVASPLLPRCRSRSHSLCADAKSCCSRATCAAKNLACAPSRSASCRAPAARLTAACSSPASCSLSCLNTPRSSSARTSRRSSSSTLARKFCSTAANRSSAAATPAAPGLKCCCSSVRADDCRCCSGVAGGEDSAKAVESAAPPKPEAAAWAARRNTSLCFTTIPSSSSSRCRACFISATSACKDATSWDGCPPRLALSPNTPPDDSALAFSRSSVSARTVAMRYMLLRCMSATSLTTTKFSDTTSCGLSTAEPAAWNPPPPLTRASCCCCGVKGAPRLGVNEKPPPPRVGVFWRRARAEEEEEAEEEEPRERSTWARSKCCTWRAKSEFCCLSRKASFSEESARSVSRSASEVRLCSDRTASSNFSVRRLCATSARL